MQFNESPISRRALLSGAASFALAGLVRTESEAAAKQDFLLVARGARLPILGVGHPATDVWSYDNRVPGPVIRTPVGEHIRIVVKNELSEATTVHWHWRTIAQQDGWSAGFNPGADHAWRELLVRIHAA